ncbi:MAG: LCP family protein, partial [Oribacterium sp.]|nr:LCP family protein [Oribacterium sp.]
AYGNGADFSGQLSMQAVSWLFAGLPIDGYLAGSMDLITSLNDFVGGVPVTVQDDFMTRADPGFVKGQTVTLQGDLAEKYVRYRDITEDFTAMTRMNRQRQYAIAFSDVLLAKQKADNKTISNMFQLIQDHIQTNMDKGQYLKVALDMAKSGPLEDQDFETIPGESRQGEEINPDTNQNQMYDQFYPDYKALDQLILADFYRTIS